MAKDGGGMHMKYSEARSLVSSYIHENEKIQDYWDLSFSQKCEIGAALFNDLTKIEKDCILSEADQCSILPNLIGDLFKNKFSDNSKERFFDALKYLLVSGSLSNRPFFYIEAQQMINDELSEQRPANNENFYDDVRERTLAAQWGQHL
jgi:hypothetical protein